jgi:hypothetical protein
MTMSEDEISRQTEEQFRGEPGFGRIEEFYREHRRRHGD